MFARSDRYTAAYTHREASREDELKVLVRWIAEQEGSGLLFVGPRANSLQQSPLASSLVNRGQATYTTGRSRDWWHQPRVIALWPTRTVLQELDDVATIDALGVLTWNPEEVRAWARGVGAIDLLGAASQDLPDIEDPTLLGALRTLTKRVNLSSGLHHPSDWNSAVHMFRALRKKGHPIDADEIEAWAIANGWSVRHAGELASLARDVASGKAKRLQAGGGTSAPTAELLRYWEEVGAEVDWSPF